MYKICLNALTVTCGFIKCRQLRTQLSGGREGLIFSVCRRAVSTCKVLADVREILWSLQRFLLPKKKSGWQRGSWAELRKPLFVWDLQEQASHTSAGTMCQMGGPEQEHQETIKFGGLSTSRGGVCVGGVRALVYIEIKAEKWETAVYISDGLFSLFPSAPKQKQRRGVMKNAALEWTWKCEPELGPHFDLQVKTAGPTLSRFATRCIHNIT